MVRGSKVGIVPLQAIASSSPAGAAPAPTPGARRAPRRRGGLGCSLKCRPRGASCPPVSQVAGGGEPGAPRTAPPTAGRRGHRAWDGKTHPSSKPGGHGDVARAGSAVQEERGAGAGTPGDLAAAGTGTTPPPSPRLGAPCALPLAARGRARSGKSGERRPRSSGRPARTPERDVVLTQRDGDELQRLLPHWGAARCLRCGREPVATKAGAGDSSLC